jgi:periplasmic protein TonB
MSNYDSEDDATFAEKHGAKIVGLVAILLCGAAAFWFMNKPKEKPRPKAATMVNITPVMPPPPPPPPPPPKPEEPEPEPEQEMEEEQAFEPEVASEAPPEPQDAAPEPIGTSITGDGPADGFGLSNKTGGGGMGGRIGGIGGGGSKYGGYAAKVQSAVANAMRQNSTTRSAVMTVDVKIWADQLGRVTRAQLGRSTGNPDLDRAIREDVLGNLRLPEPPPAEMPMPINLRLTARKS